MWLWNYYLCKKKEKSLIKYSLIDSIANDGIQKKAFPGCVVLIAKDGKVVYDKPFGYYSYDSILPMQINSVFDLASLTKILATTLGIMKLYDEKEITLYQRLDFFLPDLKGNKKGRITIRELLTHTSGLVSFIPFYKATIINSMPDSNLYRSKYSNEYSLEVAPDLFLKTVYKDSIIQKINSSPNLSHVYRYSDLNFIYLSLIIEKLSGLTLDKYVSKYFYQPMGLEFTEFNPLNKLSQQSIVPTELDKTFRNQLLQGTVHDPAAAMFGGVAGNAGLFSSANEVFVLMQMLLNKGIYNGNKYLDEKTVDMFTSYQNSSRRGLGFDKPDKIKKSKYPYPAKSASPQTFGHTGYTGTCAWADPKNNLVFILLTNRVYPPNSRTFYDLEIRYKMFEAALNITPLE